MYWKRKQSTLLIQRGPEQLLVQYLPDIQSFFLSHTLVIPGKFEVVSYLLTVMETRLFAERLFLLGTKPVLYNKSQSPSTTSTAAPGTTRTAKHDMICLAIPSLDNPDYGSIVLKPLEKDNASGPNKAQDHIVVFSSMNLLWQYTIACHDYGKKGNGLY